MPAPYRYFLHKLSDWPVAGACNDVPLGPGDDGLYLATLDATDPHCAALELGLAELTADEARIWVANMADPLPW